MAEQKQFPATAQVASQQGKYVAHFLNNLAKNKPNDSPFIYKHLGSLAYVGSNRSVADFGSGWALSGLATWWLWRFYQPFFIFCLQLKSSFFNFETDLFIGQN